MIGGMCNSFYLKTMFDSHAHVSDPAFDADRDQVLGRAQVAGVHGWVEIGTDVATSRAATALAQLHEKVWASVGVHPYDAGNIQPEDWKTLEDLAGQPKVVAIGEVGFDFSRQENTQEQWSVLEKFIALAVSKHLPVVFHVRDGANLSAHETLLELLRSYKQEERPRGVIHTFSGTWAQAQAYLDIGLYLSISGVVTFKNAGAMAEVATKMPLDRMLLETDCPYLTPIPYRGQRNEPAYVSFIAEKVAELRGHTKDEIVSTTLVNTEKFFNIDKQFPLH
jgi:TatD DNase family protein